MQAWSDAFAIAINGTTGDLHIPQGARLVGLLLPTLDSTTIVPTISYDGTTFVAAYDSGGVLIPAIGGAANVGGRVVQVPESLNRLLQPATTLRLTVATQSGGARTLKGLFVASGDA